jgi:hypothetical protein
VPVDDFVDFDHFDHFADFDLNGAVPADYDDFDVDGGAVQLDVAIKLDDVAFEPDDRVDVASQCNDVYGGTLHNDILHRAARRGSGASSSGGPAGAPDARLAGQTGPCGRARAADR